MQSNRYDIFLKILELGSLTKAADQLGYSQSAVSQAVKGLEDDLGITLLVRNRTSLNLTAEGQQLLPYIKNICNMQDQLNEKIDALKGLYTGEIRIGAYHLAACHLLPQMIGAFKKQYPEIIFRIKEGDYTEIREWINNGTVDFGFLSVQDIHDIECIPYIEDQMYAVFPSDAPESSLKSFDLQQVPDYPFIYLDEGKANDCTRIFKKNHISPDIAYAVKEDDTVLSMVENHLGISILPALAGEKHCYNVTFIPTIPSYSRTLGIAIKQRPSASRAVKQFIRFVEQHRDNIINTR